MGTEGWGTSEVKCESGSGIKGGAKAEGGERQVGDGAGRHRSLPPLPLCQPHRSRGPRVPFGQRAPPAPRRTCTHLLGAQARAGQQQQQQQRA